MTQAIALLKTMRPKQWAKNVFIFAALVFDEKLTDWPLLFNAVLGFVLFSLISGVVYTINDVADLEKDKLHPKKKKRPLPAGEIKPGTALAAAIVIAIGSLAAGFLLDPGFAVIMLAYLLLQFAYTFYLKHIVLLDVMTVSAGFVLRVAAGVPLVASLRVSPWLYVCTVLLSLFLILSKRRGELVLLGKDAAAHRKTLKAYNLPLLDQLIGIVVTSTLMAYALYTFSAPNLSGNEYMMLTIPFVVYGLFRYLYLIHVEGCTLAPDEVALTDRPLQVDLLLWGLSVVGVLYLT